VINQGRTLRAVDLFFSFCWRSRAGCGNRLEKSPGWPLPGAASFKVEMSHSCLSDRTIVVVEDHVDARRYLGLFLERTGAAVVEASNGFEGLEAVKNHQPDLVLSDINMPGANGFELLREIRALEEDTGGKVPVIAMTALVTRADRARILDAGFQACLPKPFTPEKLVETLLSVLNAW
jgi:CheY-like chemotaxis protein